MSTLEPNMKTTNATLELPLRDTVAPYLRDEQVIIAHALAIMESRLRKSGEVLNSPELAKNLFVLCLADLEHEVFEAGFLDTQNRLIAVETLFTGTLTQTSVYPREILKRSFHHNSASVIFAHNHPSGIVEPSRADELLTHKLKTALALVDIRVLDHILVGGMQTVSFAEKGLL